jgi:hypothetical protein
MFDNPYILRLSQLKTPNRPTGGPLSTVGHAFKERCAGKWPAVSGLTVGLEVRTARAEP